MNPFLVPMLLGCLTGFLGGYAGIGGAPILVALLVSILEFSQYEAQGTILAVMLGPMSLLGLVAMRERVKPTLKYALAGFLGYALFSFFGAHFAFSISELGLSRAFGVLLLVLGAWEVIVSQLGDEPTHTPNPGDITLARKGIFPVTFLNILLLGSIVGIAGGFFGIGAGVLMVPILSNLFGVYKNDARVISLMILLPPVSLGAVLKYHAEEAILWETSLIVFFSYFVTNYFGARVGNKHSPKTFRILFGLILIGIGILYFVKL